MKKFEKQCRLANLNILAERLHNEGRTADAYTIRQVLDLFKEAK
jgi:hypothetical protein